MFRKNRIYTNQLTERIKRDQNITIEEIFSDELLSVTVRNEAADFLEYIFPKDELSKDEPELPKLDLIIEYALKNKPYKFKNDQSENPFTFIISRNTANFLSSPSRKLNELGNKDNKKRIFRELRNFIATPEAQQSMCAGNFTRIFISWYNKNPEEFESEDKAQNFYKDAFSMKELIKFCVSNIKELSYSELLERLLTSDFNSDEQQILRSTIFYEILQRIRDIIGEKTILTNVDDSKNSFTILQNDTFKNYPQASQSNNFNDQTQQFSMSVRPTKKTHKLDLAVGLKAAADDQQLSKSINPKRTEKTTNNTHDQSIETGFQPFTWKIKEIPLPRYIMDEKIQEFLPLKIPYHSQTTGLIPVISAVENNFESELNAYTLMNIIWSASSEYPSLFEFIQNQQPEGIFAEKKRILEYLLFIGIFGYKNTMLCSITFKILDFVINGDENSEIKPISQENRKNNAGLDLVDYYGDFVVFKTDNLSNLAIFSFPVFYNHIYSELKAEEDGIVEYKIKDLNSLIKSENKHIVLRKHKTNEKGLTPFVYLIPVVMTEPPVSAELCTSYFKILDRLCSTRYTLMDDISKKVIEEEEELKEAIETIQKIDDIFLDFITYKFEYYGLEGRYNIFELTEKLFPLNPHFYTRRSSKMSEKLQEFQIPEKELITIHKHSERARPLINHAFVKITELISSSESFLNSEKGWLIPSKGGVKIPEHKEKNSEGQQSNVALYCTEYNKIIEESRQNKLKAGPRDKNQKIDGL